MAGYLRAGDDFAGRYRIDREIGRGGMGIVYVAHDRELGRAVALKLLHPSLTDDEFQARFQREASVLARVRSRHIVTIHDFGEYDGQSYLITELMTDGDLATWLRTKGALSRRAAVSLVAQVSEALADAHAVDVIHRDVKPGNVLLWARSSGLVPYLCDFGIAVEGDVNLTRTGTLVGSPAYMAPERHIGARADERGDIYSVGCLLWSALTGDAPYSGTDFQVANSHINGPIPQLGTGTPGDEQIDEILRRCLSKQPEDRIGSASDLQVELLRVLSLMPPETIPADEAPVEQDLSPTDASSESSPVEAVPGPPPSGPSETHVSANKQSTDQLAAPTIIKRGAWISPPPRPPSVPPSVPPAGPVPPGPAARRRWPVVVLVVAALVTLGVVLGLLLPGDEAPSPGPSEPSASTSVPVVAPSAPRIKPTSGYRSVIFTIREAGDAGPGAAVQWRNGERWVDAPAVLRRPTLQGGERVCIQARSVVVADGQTAAGDPQRVCGASEPRAVQLIRTGASCSRLIDGFRYPCVYYAVKVQGFSSNARPVAEIKPLDGRSWCKDPRYKEKFCREVPVDEKGRGALLRYFAISRDSGRVVLDVDGVRTKPVPLQGPRS